MTDVGMTMDGSGCLSGKPQSVPTKICPMSPRSPVFLAATMVLISATSVTAQSTESATPLTISPEQRIVNGSPEVGSDGRVTFRHRSGGAKAVVARGQFGKEVVLVRGENDLWAGTTEAAVAPGVYEYSLVVDGHSMPDSLNRAIKPQRWPGTSILHVPATPPAPWDDQAMPRGAVHGHTYWSPALGTWRQIVVATPPGLKVGAGAEAPLPVLYLSHGYSDTEATWTVHGRAHVILDSLISQKKAQPMIIVMPDAHALPPPSGRRDGYMAENSAAMARELIEDIIPLMEANYPVRRDAAGRAFAGLSMGGHHALTIALKHSDVFSQIGAFSSAVPGPATMDAGLPKAEEINKQLALFWVACGREDFLFQQNESLHATLEKAGVRHEYLATEGNHSWPVWRRYLVDFLPRLFKPTPSPGQ